MSVDLFATDSARAGEPPAAFCTRVCGSSGRDRVYAPKCPSCSLFHEFRVLDEEWTGTTAVRKYPRGAIRECPNTGEDIELIATQFRGVRTSW